MGSSANNEVLGGYGKDEIHGSDGDDYIDGGDQNDQMHGGNGVADMTILITGDQTSFGGYLW